LGRLVSGEVPALDHVDGGGVRATDEGEAHRPGAGARGSRRSVARDRGAGRRYGRADSGQRCRLAGAAGGPAAKFTGKLGKAAAVNDRTAALPRAARCWHTRCFESWLPDGARR
jgi:hypothetical protein